MVAEINPETQPAPRFDIDRLASWTALKSEEYLAAQIDGEVTDPRPIYVSFASKAIASGYSSRTEGLDPVELEQLVCDVADYSMGQKLLNRVRKLAQKGASDIFLKGTGSVVVHYRNGHREAKEPWYSSLRELGDDLRNLRSQFGLVNTPFDTHNPSFDAKLPGGIRINATHSVNSGFEVSFRVPDHNLTSLPDLLENSTLDVAVAKFLAAAVRAELNIIISGGTGVGKTALLLCMLSELKPLERVVTIEDRAELDLSSVHPHLDVVELEAIGANSDGLGEVTSRQLMHSSLRMHPDRIIVGEARDEIARELLQAMSSGNEGTISTIHARSPHAVIERLVECSMLDYPRVVESTRNGVDLIIHLKQLESGARRVTDIAQVSSTREADGLLRLKPIFKMPESTRTLADQYSQLVARPVGRVAEKLHQAGWRP